MSARALEPLPPVPVTTFTARLDRMCLAGDQDRRLADARQRVRPNGQVVVVGLAMPVLPDDDGSEAILAVQ